MTPSPANMGMSSHGGVGGGDTGGIEASEAEAATEAPGAAPMDEGERGCCVGEGGWLTLRPEVKNKGSSNYCKSNHIINQIFSS